MSEDVEITRPAGDYAIVEIMGHSTMIGRIAEIERFGTKMLAIEPIWQDSLLQEVLVGGQSIYRMTPCSAEVAFTRQAKQTYQLPTSLVATLPPALLPSPDLNVGDRDAFDGDDEDHPF